MLPIVDIVIVVLLIAALITGLRVGLFSALGALAGLVAGGLAAPWVLPIVARAVTDAGWRPLAVIGSAVALLALGAALGSAIGRVIRHGADLLKLKAVERLLGGVVAVVAAGLALVLTGSGIATAGIPVVSSSVASSSVLRTIDRVTPAPVSEAMARLHAATLGETVLPTIDGLLGDVEAPAGAESVDTSLPALRTSAQSVARIRGIASSCSRSLTGTGFVAAEDRIVTNAHVVAGVETPIVELPGEPARDGRVVYFDPVDDLAVIAVDVAAAALPIAETLSPGAPAAVQGFPYGGPFKTVPATVAATGSAPITDIHGGSVAPREVYALSAAVHPGNSGGPLLTPEGAVAGVIFARDEVQQNVGYAMTTAELRPVLAQLDGATEPVSTGSCVG
ncbi:MarP family serine protease [Microbacterium paludicola]|uniref:MarP family serine protease n=1 Tax=Microbacterium paludicola TaxID=300019 RepID=A0A4Y9FWZ3_9MICO|nr:MarP family serine protease [Microbacterium paludicola]MBF0815530.1 MarP family serine protease [Microbacterium paludicola]TFU33796.1 MarP family serine protease [Microbacterium paludicola]